MDTTNSQGLTAQGMGDLAEIQMKDRVIRQSQENPGTLQTGAQMGTYMAGQDAKPATFQAYTANNPSDPQAKAPTQEKKQFDTLSAKPAEAYVKTETQKLQEQKDQLQAETERFSGGIHDMIERNKQAAQIAGDYQFGTAEKRQKMQQEEGAATAKALEFKAGRASTDYAKDYLKRFETYQDLDRQDLQRQKADYIQTMANNLSIGGFRQFEDMKSGLAKLDDQIAKAKEKEAATAKDAREAMKFFDDQADKTAKRMALAGFSPSKEVLEKVAEAYGQDPFSFSLMLEANRAEVGIQQKKDELELAKGSVDYESKLQDLRQSSIEQASKFADFLGKTATGGSVTVGDVEYTVTGKSPEVIANTETDIDGNVTQVIYDKQTGRTTLVPLGNIGTAKEGWSTQVLGDGSVWRVNARTGQSEPFYASQAQTTWNGVLPEGQQGPVLPGNPAAAGQCGAFCNWAYGERVLGNTFNEKMASMKSFGIKSADEAEVGDTFLMSAGDTGHVGIINGIERGPGGKKVFKFSESNYVPPGQGLMSHSRTMAADDPRLKAFASIPTPNLPLAGPDSIASNYAMQGPAVLGAGSKAKAEDKLLTVAEARDLKVPYGTTQSQAAAMGIKPDKKVSIDIGDKVNWQKFVRDDGWVKDFPTIQRSYQTLESAYAKAIQAGADKTTRAAADQALITVFNKVLDPNSVVREGEYARSEQGQSVLSQAEGYWNRLKQGGTAIDDAARKEMVDVAKLLFDNSLKDYTSAMNYYSEQADELGIDPDKFLRRVDLQYIRPKESAPKGEVWVMTKSGEVGSVPAAEADSSDYIKL